MNDTKYPITSQKYPVSSQNTVTQLSANEPLTKKTSNFIGIISQYFETSILK